MSDHRTTASKSALLLACGFPFRPEAEWVDTTSPAADRGNRFHAAIATYIASGAVPELDEDIAPLFASARAWVDHFGRERLAAEVAFAWDPDTDRAERIFVSNRDYSVAGERFCGTADIVAISRVTRTGYIGDWKTGDGSGAGPQLRSLAMMLARAEDLLSVTVEALEVDAAGVRHVCTETLDEFALAAVAGELADAKARVPAAEPTPGPHCSELYCPARATCPAGREAIAQILPASELVRWTVEIEGPEHAAWLYERAKLVEAAADAVKAAVKAYVPESGLQLPDGSLLVERTKQMPWFGKDRAIAMLREKGATDEEIESLTTTRKQSNGLRVEKTGLSRLRGRGKAA